jgi:tight adherence protein B
MLYGDQLPQIAFVAMIAIFVGGLIIAVLYAYFTGSASTSKRVRAIASNSKQPARPTLKQRLMNEDPKDSRRKQLQETLKQIEQREKQRKKRLTLRVLIMQAGLEIRPPMFWMSSIGLGLVIALVALIAGLPWWLVPISGAVGMFGIPRWVLGFIRKRRQATFLNDFADAVDVMVRGLKAGLPITDAMRVIATETGPPVGPEFMEIIEGQRVGITIEQGIERMFERMPLSEVNFLGIVMAIQSKTGGNLAEALSNLSKVLRDRKKMKMKIKAVSQEAKASAAIIGSLPILIMVAMTLLNPEYLNPLFYTKMGNILIAGSATWMFTGVLVMRKMIQFEI